MSNHFGFFLVSAALLLIRMSCGLIANSEMVAALDKSRHWFPDPINGSDWNGTVLQASTLTIPWGSEDDLHTGWTLCVDLAVDVANRRSNASHDDEGLPWSLKVLNVTSASSTRPQAQATITCSAFDYGAVLVNETDAPHPSFAGYTPHFKPNTTYSSCSRYADSHRCDDTDGRCWWNQLASRCEAPPLTCAPFSGENTTLQIICIHVRIRGGAESSLHYRNDSGSYNANALVHPSGEFRYDLWYSVVQTPGSNFQYCVQYTSDPAVEMGSNIAQPMIQNGNSTTRPTHIEVCLLGTTTNYLVNYYNSHNLKYFEFRWFTYRTFIGLLEFDNCPVGESC
jgi:hypothetical protein